MIILRYSYDNFVTEENILCTGWSFYIFLILWTKIKNYEFGWQCALLTLRKSSMGMAIVKHCYAHCEWINKNNYG
jgi:hypothetical protein